jgi:dipeptidyl aminopeptidase/acylaminoacyl peptidase
LPDGKRAAFVTWEWVNDQPKQRGRIWVVETVGGDSQPLTKGPCEDSYPRWSPNGQHLAFVSKRDGEGSKSKAQLYLIAAQGGEAQQVCTMPDGVSDLAWSPDGGRIAFLAREGEKPRGDPRVVLLEQGRHLRLWTVRPDSDTPKPVTPDGLSVWEYAWSPDGRHVAVYYTAGPEETDWYRGQIGIVAAGGGVVSRLTQLHGHARALTWAPDGTRLAYIVGNWSDPGLGGGDIYILSLHDGKVRNLTPAIECSPSWCRWFPDGRRLLYAAWDGVMCQKGLADEAEGTMTMLDKDFVLGERFWPHLSTTSDLRYVVGTHSERHPPDVWFCELTHNGDAVMDIAWRRLSRLNPIAEETLALVPTKRISYMSVDGWQIDAILTLPSTPRNNTLPPLVVSVHGGLSGFWYDDWEMYRSQILAAAGFAVLRPNIRGSMGRGVAFADEVLGDMGGKDFQDILYGIQYLVDRKLVDGGRVGIMRWSYGGFMSAWAVTQTSRFKDAIMGAGICDFHGFHAQSNISDWDMLFLGTEPISPLEHPEIYRERSAITHAGRVTSPTLIIHGENDECVPVIQAHAFYRALREQSVPVELVIYPREGHAFEERDHLRDYQERMLSWFERYLR